MRSKRGPLGLLVLTAAFLVLAFGASSAHAAFGIEKWEALTCEETEEAPSIAFPPGAPIIGPLAAIEAAQEAVEECTDGTPDKLFTQATGHPPFGITDFILNNTAGFPDGFVKDIVVDTPEGLGVNPEAYDQCSLAVAEVDVTACPVTSLVGFNYLTAVVAPGPTLARAASPVYNIEPFDGTPSMVGFPDSTGETVYIVGSLDPVDQHVIFTISDVHAPDATHPAILGSRLIFFGTKNLFSLGDGTYLTLPSNCGPQIASLHVDQHADPGNFVSDDYEPQKAVDECESAPFDPDLDATASGSTDSPEPATVDVQMPKQLEPEKRAQSHLLTARVTLPDGAGLNPSLANGLDVCTNGQFKQGTDDPIECPAASRIGSIEVETPALDQDLGGDLYVGQPLNNNPSSGDQFRVFLHAYNDRYGVNVRLIGNVFPNLETGQLTVVVPNNPQAPFSSFKVNVDGGPTGALTTPDTCGPHTVTAGFTPWSRPNTEVPPASNPQFTLGTLPGGGPCPATLAERPLDPYYASAPGEYKAGQFTEFRLDLVRQNGNQEVKRVDVNLPPGMVAKLRGLEYCPQANIDAAGARSGTSVIADPACPDSSWLGTADIGAGSGSPYNVTGNAYLAGPYKGAPVSMVFITPAVAGPFDLGNVVVRVALNVDRETAEVHAVSDPIPNVFGGVKLDIRTIRLFITRPNFTINPTTCREPLPIKTSVFGGGGNPADANAWQEVSRTEGLQFGACRKLRFRPSFYARIFGGKNQTKRAQNPKFRAIFDARKGDANLRRAAFILPRATILDQSHIKTICTRVQLAANKCPKNSIYGHARANSPLLDGVLKGPVYLTSSSNELPDLLVDLKGQVPIRLRGVISSKNARLKTVFNGTPDVAVNKFILTMKGGNRGLLINSRNLCASRTSGFLNLLAQNSRRMRTKNLQLNIPACRGGRRN